MMTFVTSATRVWRLLSRVDALPPACSQPLRLVSRSHGCFFYPRLVLLALARILPNPGRYVHHRRYRLNLEPLPWPVPYRPSDTEGLGNQRFRGSGENQGFPGQGRDLKTLDQLLRGLPRSPRIRSRAPRLPLRYPVLRPLALPRASPPLPLLPRSQLE